MKTNEIREREIINCICKDIKDFTDIAVIGLSGGADSTLVACLCKKALGPENVYGIGMPYNDFDKETFNDLSEKIAKKLGINYNVCPVNYIANAIDRTIEDINTLKLTAVNSGNSRSRARMCVLYSFAHALSTQYDIPCECCGREGKRVRVMGTGNLSEDFIGYDTKGGDALADIFPIGELYKSEVYDLLYYFASEGFIEKSLINKTPSAGLEDGQTDEGDLGYSYNEMEAGIRTCKKNYNNMQEAIRIGSVDKVTNFVWERHLTNKHKHEAPPTIRIREHLDY
jgi:NAD+ synthase